jgi:two-component system, cell cycle response regulator DivK
MTHILLVEDNDQSREVLSRRLLRRGFEVSGAATGPTGLERAAALRPDLILMDVSLPEMSGFEVTRRLKADPATGRIPVIFLTAHSRLEDEAEAQAAGADGFAVKPVDLENLLLSIRTALETPRG